MDYLELSIQMSSKGDGTYRVHAASEQGEGAGAFTPPFTTENLYGIVHGVEPPAQPSDVAPPPPPPMPLGAETVLGRQLFQAIFSDQVGVLLKQTQTAARDAGLHGVRVRLGMDLSDPRLADVASLPWEMMCDDDGPLAVSTRSVLVRAIDAPQPVGLPPYDAPLRILVLKSNPTGTAPLDLQTEIEAEQAIWAKRPQLVAEVVRATKSEILDRLAANTYHVVHYSGHGGFNPSVGGRLLLEAEDGSIQRVAASEFAAWLEDQPVRLVFLNACETGRTPGSADLPAFAGVATALIRAGIPAVVGMQFAVSDWGATTFAETFYKRIVQGFPVDAATAEGRKALYSPMTVPPAPIQWATPVLYMRSHDGDLFPVAPVAGTPAPGVAAPPPPPPPPPPPSSPKPEPVMAEPSNRGVSIGGSVTGSVIQTGDNNAATLTFTTTTLPPAASVDIAAVLKDLREMAAQMQLPPDGKAARKVANALDEADDEATSPTPDKPALAEALTRAVGVLKEAGDFAAKTAPLAKLVVSAAGWLGGGLAGPLLSLVGLTQ